VAAAVVLAVAAIGIYAVATRGDGESSDAGGHRSGSANPRVTTATDSSSASHLLSQRDVDRYPKASPERALLAWWRAAQFVDYQGFLEAFDSQLRRKLSASPKTRRALVAFGGFASASTLKFFNAQQGRQNAIVYIQVRYESRGSDGKLVTQPLPRTFRFVRQGGAWRLKSDDFVQETLPQSLRRS
jgi:hypothetical protein